MTVTTIRNRCTTGRKRLVLETNANAEQLGCVLLQDQDDESLRPVGYFVQAVNEAERNHDTTEHE